MNRSAIIQQPDEHLLQRIQQGDERALEALFKKYYPSLLRFARGIVQTREDAEDIVQGVFIKIWDMRGSLDIHTALKAYLYMAVKNRCFNQLKQNEKKYWMDESFKDDLRVSTEPVVYTVAVKDLDREIRAAIEKLPPKCGLIFKLSRFEEKSYKEIAAIMEISVKTVENQMGRALQLMRTMLKEHLILLVFGTLQVFSRFF
jgi:RNA polymerase sigma-70 factor (family 1)